LTQNKDFRTVFPFISMPYCRAAMQNPRRVSDLLSRTGNKLTALKTRSQERSRVLEQVRAALPARLAEAVASAGIEQGRLTIGVVGAVWASRKIKTWKLIINRKKRKKSIFDHSIKV